MKKSLVLTGFALLLTACGTPPAEEPIKVGYVGPITGDAASYGVDMMNGVKLKVDEINAAGGVGGRMVDLIVEDGRCTGADAASAAQKLIHVDKVAAIIGGVCSSETLAMAPIAEPAEIIVLSPGSTSPDITTAGEYVFRDIPSDALGSVALKRAMEKRGLTRIAILSENTDFAVGWRDSVAAQFGEENVVFSETFDPGVKDHRTVLTRLQDEEFDVLFANGQTVPTTASIIQQFRELGFTQQIVSHSGAESPQIVDIAGDAAEGVLFVTQPSLGEGSEMIARFRTVYGEPQQSTAFVSLAYDAAGVLLDAVEAVGIDGPAIRDYFKYVSYEGVVGTISFDENGDVKGVPFALRGIGSGTIVDVENVSVD